jgi:outer membrane receptor protein involved in Fe transport
MTVRPGNVDFTFAARRLLLPFLLPAMLLVAAALPAAANDTMLMFVGEPLAVVTAASRTPETPAAAPALVTVVTRRTIRDRGYETLAELLRDQAGFFMAPGPEGTVPFLRGIPDGILILYDGVPLTMEVDKTLHPLDRELSLNGVSRVEIIRGPGSVLWGPDAFAGIVNVVPLTGREFTGAAAAGQVGTDDLAYGHGAAGYAGDGWDMFVTASGGEERYHDDRLENRRSVTNPALSLPAETISPSHYRELAANARVGDWLKISARLSDFTRRYTLHDSGDFGWSGERETPVSFIQGAITRPVGSGHWTLSGYYQNVRYEITDVDLRREQENDIYQGEIMIDQRLGRTGLLTVGASLRENRVQGALISGGFLPDFLKPENEIFVPRLNQADYDTRLWSAYTQYRHRLGPVDCWFGLRFDDHDRYDAALSWSLGANWAASERLRLKVVGGTAYRSPYPAQLYDTAGMSADPEQITTASLQAAWNALDGSAETALTIYYNRLADHIADDPYGGLSAASKQHLAGLELESGLRPHPDLRLHAAGSIHRHWGDELDFSVRRGTYIRPDGTFEEIWEYWDQPFDDGPGWTLAVGATWEPDPRLTLHVDVTTAGYRRHRYTKDTVTETYHQPLLLDVSLRLRDFLPLPGAELTLRGRNILDRDYDQAGRYGAVEGPAAAVSAELGCRF